MRDRIGRYLRGRFGARRGSGGGRGQSLTEFALVLPVFLLVVAMGLDFGRAFMGWVGLQQAARIAANFASVNPQAWDSPGGSKASRDKYQELLANEMGTDPDPKIDCDVPKKNKFPVPTFPGGGSVGQPAVVTLDCQFHLITPIISAILPNPFPMSASATFPIRTGSLAGVPGPLGPVPVASFSCSPACPPGSGNSPFSVQFLDTSTKNPTAWSWAFGDGATDTTQFPSHTFTCATGTCVFTVTLTATNINGSSATAGTHTITVQSPTPAPSACFTMNPTSGIAPVSIQFTDCSTPTPMTSWSWTFGDGGTSTLQSPAHTYSSANTYTPMLTVTNAGGSGSISHSITISAAVCLVPSFASMSVVGSAATSAILSKWTTAGFIGTHLFYNPSTLPTKGNHTVKAIGGQTLAAGTYQLCTATITLNWT